MKNLIDDAKTLIKRIDDKAAKDEGAPSLETLTAIYTDVNVLVRALAQYEIPEPRIVYRNPEWVDSMLDSIQDNLRTDDIAETVEDNIDWSSKIQHTIEYDMDINELVDVSDKVESLVNNLMEDATISISV